MVSIIEKAVDTQAVRVFDERAILVPVHYLRVFVVAPAGARQFVRVADTRFGRGHDGEIITGRATDGSLPRIKGS